MGKQFDVVFLLFLCTFFVFSHIKDVLQISKKFVFGIWGTPQQAWKGISLSPACTQCNFYIYIQIL
jgi:hypothetical protein